jgi:hypothetical protein
MTVIATAIENERLQCVFRVLQNDVAHMLWVLGIKKYVIVLIDHTPIIEQFESFEALKQDLECFGGYAGIAQHELSDWGLAHR